jgi:hypothetical protein
LPEQLPRLRTLEISNCKQLVASVLLVPSIHQLHLNNCGKLQFDYHPYTLRILKIGGKCMEESLLEWVGHTLSHTFLESLVIEDFPTMRITLDCSNNFLTFLSITSSCDSLKTLQLDFFPKLQSLKLRNCSNLEMISHELEHEHSLTRLTIIECPKFVSFPKGGFSAPCLKHFDLCKLENLKSLPEFMHTISISYWPYYNKLSTTGVIF